MKKQIISSILLTCGAMLLLAVAYPLLVLGLAQLFPNKGKGEVVVHHGKTYYANIGQAFVKDEYFWSRPSAVGYNASGSGASNKGPSNEAYLVEVQGRIDTFLKHNPGVKRSEIPVDLITSSGSGLDPHISVAAAMVQVKRVAGIRKLEEAILYKLVRIQTERPLLGLLGPEKVNVLKLNIALENLNH